MTDQLNPGQFIQRGTPNSALTSANGKHTLNMQDDGNLVLYDGQKAIWATNTAQSDGQKAIMQEDGNFVLYHVNGKPLWASNTSGKPGCHIVLQDDGNLVIYQPVVPVWATTTAGK